MSDQKLDTSYGCAARGAEIEEELASISHTFARAVTDFKELSRKYERRLDVALIALRDSKNDEGKSLTVQEKAALAREAVAEAEEELVTRLDELAGKAEGLKVLSQNLTARGSLVQSLLRHHDDAAKMERFQG